MNTKARILLAEPDEELRTNAQRALERQAYSVTSLADGADALAQFSSSPHDLVLAAVDMPQRDGVEILRHIKTERPGTPVILLADPGSMGSAALGLREGAFICLQKPLEDLALLTCTVERALELYRLEHAPSQPQAVSQAPDPELERAIQALIDAARTGRPVPGTCNLLARASAMVFDAPHAVVLVRHAENKLQAEAGFGFDSLIALRGDLSLQVRDSFLARVAADRVTLIDSHTPNIVSIGTPLIARDRALGVVIVYPIPESDATTERIALFEDLAGRGAIALLIAQLAEENARLSPADPPTDALSRPAFIGLAEREFRRSWRFHQPMTLVLLDIATTAQQTAARAGSGQVVYA